MIERDLLSESTGFGPYATQIRCLPPALPDEFDDVSMPPLPPFIEGLAEIPGARLYYRDFGGEGQPLLLVHPATGSALMWGYQVAAFKAAGYRVIAYSRRGHYGSQASAPGDCAPSVDLNDLLDVLRIETCFVVATAAGCTVTLDFAISHSDRLRAVAVSSGAYSNLDEPDYRSVSDRVRTQGLAEMPPEFRELGPSYRGANPHGVTAWLELEHHTLVDVKPRTDPANAFTWNTLERISAPVLFIAGGADLAAPPTMMRHVAGHVRGAELVVIPDSGHSVYWERPLAFNQTIIEFFRRRAPG